MDVMAGRYDGILAQASAVSVALDERDPATFQHCDRVAWLTHDLGVRCGLSERELVLLRVAAAFHDVGKIGIPDRVLKKATPFDESDWEIMRSHAVKSERIMRAVGLDGGDEIARGIRHHHERFDGTGYPDRLAGKDIPLLARIVAIADAYDEMARERCYAPSRTHEEIMEELYRERGRQHDPDLLEKFAEVIERSSYRAA